MDRKTETSFTNFYTIAVLKIKVKEKAQKVFGSTLLTLQLPLVYLLCCETEARQVSLYGIVSCKRLIHSSQLIPYPSIFSAFAKSLPI